MIKEPLKFEIDNAIVNYYFDVSFKSLTQIVDKKDAIILTDTNVYAAHKKKFESWRTILIPPGEVNKNQDTVNNVIDALIKMLADRKTVIIGVGGGVVTDLAGYVASIYLRGVRFGFIPTTLLNIIDGSIGGKNGIDVGLYKNMVGTIRQPEFIFLDISFLETLPRAEWVNGFAEIIKHSLLKDRLLFEQLEKYNVDYFMKRKTALLELIEKNIKIKLEVVQKDPKEEGERKILNLGHTFAHAIENQYQISHGKGVAVGIVMSLHIAIQELDFKEEDRVVKLLEKYELFTNLVFDPGEIVHMLMADKKRVGKTIDYILLQEIGKPVILQLSMLQMTKYLTEAYEKWK